MIAGASVAVLVLSLGLVSGGRSSLRCTGSHCRGFSCGAQALEPQASVVAAQGLNSCSLRALERGLSSCSTRATHGIFLDPGSNPRPLHWQADSCPLFHQGSPSFFLYLAVLGLSCNSRDLKSSLWHVTSFLVVACRIFSCSMWTLSCGTWDLVPWPGMEPMATALGVRSVSHWTTREVPLHFKMWP